jgi:pyruvate dehydrogenase E2 component (dihydrolipoamide acetyltransferase)
MESGTVGQWLLKEGEAFSAGDTIAEIETDKASMGFEAQDDGIFAKILVDAGVEVKCGVPILVTVEEEEDVAAFANFEAPATEAAAPAPAPVPTPAPPAAPVQSTPEAVVPAAAAAAAPAAAAPAAAPAVDSSEGPRWGSRVANSALARAMANEQAEYLHKYGHSFHRPIKA